MDTDVKKQGTENQKPKTVKGVFNSMLVFYVGQMKRQSFDEDGYRQGTYRFVVDTITKEIEKDMSKASEYTKILEMADKFYKLVIDPKVRERVIDENMEPEDFFKYYGDMILGEYKRKYDMSHNYQRGVVTTEKRRDKDNEGINMDSDTPYTKMPNMLSNVQSQVDKKREDARKPKPQNKKMMQFTAISNGKRYQDREITIQEIGLLRYTSVGNVGGNSVRKYSVTRGKDDKVEEVVYSNIDLYDMDTDPHYREVVLGELLSDANIKKSNVSGYIGEIRDDLGDLKQMKIGQEIDDGDYIYKTPYKSREGKFYGLLFDAQDLSAVVDFEREKAKEKEAKIPETEVKPVEGPEL